MENRLVAVTDTVTLSVTQFVYDGSGSRVLTIWPDGSKTAFVGEHYEVRRSSAVSGSHTITRQPGSQGEDSYVDSENPDINYGRDTSLYVSEGRLMYPIRYKHFLVRLDLSAVPSGALVEEATLTLYCASQSLFLYPPVDVYRVTDEWTEYGVVWYSLPGTDSSPSASFAVTSTSFLPYTIPLTSLVQGWVDGAWDNQGLMVKNTSWWRDFGYQCVSSDGGPAAQRPKLAVTYRSDTSARSYYYLGSRRIALRVSGDPDPGKNGLFYIHTDHLGSTSLLSDDNGDLVEGSTTRFLPFGEYRVEPEAKLTDKAFTGHAHNDTIKLIDMKARWYSPQLGRFLQPDTIVPTPSNPQSFSRYSYVNNRPLVAVDPTGHAPSDGCDYEGCSLPIGYYPDSTWMLPNGAIVHWDPILAAAEDYNPITEAVLPGLGMTLAIAGAPALISGGREVIIALIELVCADGDCGNEITQATNSAKQGFRSLSRAAEFGVQRFNDLWEMVRGTGLERHHIVEQRFSGALGLNPGDMPSVVLTPEEHQMFTNAWRAAIGYVNSGDPVNTATATVQDIWLAAQQIYADYPALLEAARQTIFGQ